MIVITQAPVISSVSARSSTSFGSQTPCPALWGGPRHSVERGHGSLKRDVARAASSCARHHRQVGQAHQTGGTYFHHNRGHDHAGQPAPAARASPMATAAGTGRHGPAGALRRWGGGARLGPALPPHRAHIPSPRAS